MPRRPRFPRPSDGRFLRQWGHQATKDEAASGVGVIDWHGLRAFAGHGLEVAAGGRVYVVLPLVEESEKMALRDATRTSERVREAFPKITVGLLHGRMKPDEKDEAMTAFRARPVTSSNSFIRFSATMRCIAAQLNRSRTAFRVRASGVSSARASPSTAPR